MSNINFKQVTTRNELNGAFGVRQEVFIIEQGIAKQDEYDGLDNSCLQFIARSGRKVIGTARVRFPDPGCAKIERMAVLKTFRRQGIGSGILSCIEEELKRQSVFDLVLHAQLTAVTFYRACGFTAFGDTFYEAGVEHVKMQKRLAFLP
jgi:predicted GNAT family N-acyltransferase